MSALVTGFEPFGGAELNASEQLIVELRARNVPGLSTQVLPTSYRRAEQTLLHALAEQRPKLLLMLGLHAAATNLLYEQVALNLNDAAKPDNDGETRRRISIREQGPVGYFSSLGFEPMAKLAARHAEELVFSRDAGGFVCNHVFYTAAHWAASGLPNLRVGFVHVPPLDSLRCTRITDLLLDWVSALTEP
jgi:pyroglutamyl-peptidase